MDGRCVSEQNVGSRLVAPRLPGARSPMRPSLLALFVIATIGSPLAASERAARQVLTAALSDSR